MSWIAEYDTHGREFPTCVHVTKATNTMTHGDTYVPIAEGRAVRIERDCLRIENTKLRELVKELWEGYQDPPCEGCPLKNEPACADCPTCAREAAVIDCMRELGIEVDE